jgi:hypothetical protein
VENGNAMQAFFLFFFFLKIIYIYIYISLHSQIQAADIFFFKKKRVKTIGKKESDTVDLCLFLCLCLTDCGACV